MANTRKKFRFLELPPEIREFIYKEAFVDEFAVHGANNTKVYPPGILLSCKQVHLEAVRIFYNFATFRFWEYDFGVEWYTKLPSMYRDTITKMRYDMQTPEIPKFGHTHTAGLRSQKTILDFWKDAGKPDSERPMGTLAVSTVIWWDNKLPDPCLYQLWDGEPPHWDSLPSQEARHKIVWVSEDAEWKQRVFRDSMLQRKYTLLSS